MELLTQLESKYPASCLPPIHTANAGGTCCGAAGRRWAGASLQLAGHVCGNGNNGRGGAGGRAGVYGGALFGLNRVHLLEGSVPF